MDAIVTTSDPFSDLCRMAIAFAGNRLMFFAYFFFATIDCVAMVLILRQILKQKRLLNLHRNTLLLMFSHHLATLGMSIFRFASRIQNIWNALTNQGCDLIVPYSRCVSYRGPLFVCTNALHMALLTILVERVVATYCVKRYEQFSGKFYVAMAIVLQWLFGIVTFIYVFLDDDFSGQLAYCRFGSPINTYILAFIDCVTIVCLYLILIRNRRVQGKVDTRNLSPGGQLSQKYQLSENVRTITAMIWISWVFLIFIAGPNAFNNIVSKFIEQPTMSIIVECTAQQSVYGIVQALIIEFQHHVGRKATAKRMAGAMDATRNPTSVYHKTMKNTWNS